MRLWIAIIAGLSLGQSQDVVPLPPEDPSVRDPAAAALQDAYEQAADDLDGARPPQGYAIQTPTDPTQGNYRGLTPLLPDGSPPVTSGDVAVQQSQTYVPPPVPTVFDQQPASGETDESQPSTGTGGAGTAGTSTEQPDTGAGAAGTASTVGGTTAGQSSTGAGAAGTSPTSGPTSAEAPGFGGTYNTDATSSTAPGSVAPGGTGEQPLDTSRVTVQEPGTATGGAGTAGTTGTGTTAPQGTTTEAPAPTTPESATGGTSAAGTTGTGTATPEPATGGAGTTGTATPQVTTTEASTPTTPESATGGASAAGVGTATPQGTTTPDQGGTSAVTPSNPTAQAPQGAQEQPPSTQAAASANEELTRLRQRVADLEKEVEARDAQATERTQSVQTQVDTHEQRAYEAERARQQRLARIQSGGQWMLAADQALEQGELGVDNALGIADEDFSVVGQSASTFGQGTIVVHSERIRAQIAVARDAANRRDIYAARIALQNAGDELRLARAANLERSSTANTLLNP
ncbi:hypothetical protein [Corallococcus sp. RDP092CA]|uniref:hypothetical protein n=1 Tax=Corallococcus sp. RDP092CA TaxID=3109369 RepID=UPI0035B28C1F